MIRILLLISILCFTYLVNAQNYKNDAFFGYSYYTNETNATLYVESSLTDNINVIIRDTSGTSMVFQSSNIPVNIGLNEISISLASISTGNYYGEVTWISALDTISKVSLIKLAPLSPGNEVKVDRYNRSIMVNGNYFLPFGAASLGEVSFMDNEGFNMALRWGARYTAPTAIAAANDPFLNDCYANGLFAIDRPTNTQWPSNFYGDPTPAWIANYNNWVANELPPVLSTVKNDPAYIGMMGLDEPGMSGLEYYAKDAVYQFKKINPYHPTMNSYNHGGEINEWQCENDDIIQDYIYWQVEYLRGRDINRFAKSTADFAKSYNKPFFAMPMTELNFSAGSSPIIPEEQFANTYLMLINGATGVYYFTWPNFHRHTVESMKDLGAELTTLAPALTRRPVNQKLNYFGLDSLNEAVKFTLRTKPDGTPVIIFVNITDYAVDIECEMPFLVGSPLLVPLVNRGNATLNSSGSFIETLEPLATRAYEIQGYTISDSAARQLHPINLTLSAVGNSHQIVNLIGDPGFETTTYWTAYGVGGGATITYDTIDPYSGNACIKFHRPNTSSNNLSIESPVITLQPNHSYEVGWSKKQNVTVFPTSIPTSGATLYVRQLSGPALEAFDISSGTEKANFDWKPTYAKIFRTGDSAINVKIEIVDIFNEGDFWADDVYLIDRGPLSSPIKPVTINIVPNSSFEYDRLPKWPNKWALSAYQGWVNDSIFVSDPNAPFGMDSVNAYHGQYSLRIKGGWNNDEVPYVFSKPSNRFEDGIPAKSGRTYTFSCYMRASAPNTPVTISINQIGSQTFNVGTSWTRYSFTNTKGTGWPPDYTHIDIEVDGIAWIDAVQLEEGSSATPYVDDQYVPEYPKFDPTPMLNGPYVQQVNFPVSFSSNGSIDIDGSIASYLWDFGDGNVSSSPNPTHTYIATGVYTVTLTVTDNEGRINSHTTTATISSGSVNIDENNMSNGFVMYPNPAKENLIINNLSSFNATVNILTINGKTVLSQAIKPGINTFNFSDLSKGVYIVNYIDNNSYKEIKKLIIK